jgi:hypothetical protein
MASLSRSTAPRIPAAWGEVLDKIAILEIKQARIAAEAAQANIRHELGELAEIVKAELHLTGAIDALFDRLRIVNEVLWDIEDAIRAHERAGDFGAEFVTLARSVYVSNDERAALKRQINLLTASTIVEEKSYHAY